VKTAAQKNTPLQRKHGGYTMGQPNLPSRHELTANVAKVFHGTGYVVHDAWLEVWTDARYLRLSVGIEAGATEDIETLAGCAWELRKRVVKKTGLPFVVVVYGKPMSPKLCRQIIARMAKRFG
jgi:2-oxo-4-hydroxy-4-carboxy--5-ureidoimidazoline (OHCU) decarboxylase